MSRRTREGQRLAEDLARVINQRPAVGDRRMSRTQALAIKQEDARLLEQRRASSMRVLLQRQWMPWLAGGIVMAVAAFTWLLEWLSSDRILPFVVVTGAVSVVAWFGWMAGRRTKRWRSRVHFAAGFASVFLVWTAATGPSFRAPLVLVLGTVLCSARWWQAFRPAHPLAPSRDEVPDKGDLSITALWRENLGATGAVLAGSYLNQRDTSKANCESYTVNLRPGKQTITGVLSQLELIAGGLFTPVKQLVLEPHPNHNPNHVKLTVVQESPIDKTLEYQGARFAGERQNMIEVGPYGDGDGYARWRMWQPGEQPMTGSWLSGLIIAGTGIGKSRLAELLAAAYMASGSAVVWFNDPQGGASSPALQEYADWYSSNDRVSQMLGALERIAAAREKENSVEGWMRFDPSPERPGIIAIMDEGHVTIKRYGDRMEALARKTQKVGIGFIVLTQGASLESLGKDILRASLMANVIVMKTGSSQTKNLLPGLPVDPEMLPKIPGFGYSVGTDGSRTAPFRSEYIAKPEEWFARYPMAKLDRLSANAAGEVYQLRREAAVEEQQADREEVEQLRNGFQPTLDEPDLDDEGPAEPTGGAFQVAQFPTALRAVESEKPSDQRVLVAVAQGITRTAEIQKAVGLKPSQLHAVLKALVEDNQLEQPTRGVYAIAGSASAPER